MLNQELQDIFKGKKRLRIIETLEVIHTETNMRYFFCKYPNPINLVIEDGTTHEFTPSNFVVSLPSFEENANLDINVSFGLVGFQYIKQLETIIRTSQEKIKFKYRFYTENNLKFPQTKSPFLFSVNAIDIQNRTVSFGGSQLMSIQTKMPKMIYTVENFRGLKYLS